MAGTGLPTSGRRPRAQRVLAGAGPTRSWRPGRRDRAAGSGWPWQGVWAAGRHAGGGPRGLGSPDGSPAPQQGRVNRGPAWSSGTIGRDTRGCHQDCPGVSAHFLMDTIFPPSPDSHAVTLPGGQAWKARPAAARGRNGASRCDKWAWGWTPEWQTGVPGESGPFVSLAGQGAGLGPTLAPQLTALGPCASSERAPARRPALPAPLRVGSCHGSRVTVPSRQVRTKALLCARWVLAGGGTTQSCRHQTGIKRLLCAGSLRGTGVRR